MQLRDRAEGYGLVTVGLHWFMAVLLAALFALGLYLDGLDYYDPFYRSASTWHEGGGMLALALLAIRLVWVLATPRPRPLAASRWERGAAQLVHWTLYALTGTVALSGYLLSTADGHPLEVFGLVRLPAPFGKVEGLADMAGKGHAWLALGLAGLAVLHTLAALKHHFLDRDRTLLRMLSVASGPSEEEEHR